MGRSYKELSIIMLGIVVGTVFALLSVIFLYTMKGFDLIIVSFFVFFVSLLMLWTIYSISQSREEKFISATKREWIITSSGVIGGILFVVAGSYIGGIMFFFMFLACSLSAFFFLIFNERWEKSIPVDTERKILIEHPENLISLLETFRSRYNKENTKIYYGMDSIDFFYNRWDFWFLVIFILSFDFLKVQYYKDDFIAFLPYVVLLFVTFLFLNHMIGRILRYIGEKRKDRILREHPILRYKLYSSTIGIFNENRYILVFDFSKNCVYEIVRDSSKISEKMSKIIKNVHRYLDVTRLKS